eukprot:COSAG03_NODE_304_length_9180_cov_78.498293_13_plen_61_part_00
MAQSPSYGRTVLMLLSSNILRACGILIHRKKPQRPTEKKRKQIVQRIMDSISGQVRPPPT